MNVFSKLITLNMKDAKKRDETNSIIIGALLPITGRGKCLNNLLLAEILIKIELLSGS